ncbi:replication initiation protein [Photobacterium damselae]|uniref:replication initiation protein n=1 Tax=Photobacterium damselae TaxID=38293 RepID=UPI001F435B18|nr:replication initiation protein [Photobacterium damselae]UKA04933.1 replication initiation protein [Photobacterium damselae subsp. damselae]
MNNPQVKLPTQFKKSHELVFSQQDLSSREANVFALMMASMRENDWENGSPRYSFSSQKIVEYLGLNKRAISSQLAPVCRSLSSRCVGILEQNKDKFDFRPLFKRVVYKDAVLTLVPNDELKNEYLLHSQGFALIKTASYLNIKGEYTKRLYEMLSRFKHDGFKLPVMSIERLQAYLGVLEQNGTLKESKKSFKNTSLFLDRCVRKSIAELQQNTKTNKEIHFITNGKEIGFKCHKTGTKITAIEFTFKWIADITAENAFSKITMAEAKSAITELETRRARGDNIDIKDLKILAHAYRSLNHESANTRASEIDIEIATYSEQPEQTENIDDFLDKLDMLKAI